ncbi:hypothetical protein B566_EDAN004952, partial [Ephemera danica]
MPTRMLIVDAPHRRVEQLHHEELSENGVGARNLQPCLRYAFGIHLEMFGISGQCPSHYGGTWLKCPIDGGNSREMNVGDEIHCACNINCAPVTAKCEAQGGRKAWKFDKTLCHPLRNYTSKMVPGLDANLLVTYQANKGYSFECSAGYKLNGGNEREYRDRTAADSNLKYSLMNGIYTFKCVNGRGLQGSPTIVCKDGKLSDALPKCASTVPPTKVPNYDPHILVSYASQVYRVSCEMGYSLRRNVITAKCNGGTLNLLPRPSCVGFSLHGAQTASCTDGTLALNTAPVCRKQCLEISNEIRCLLKAEDVRNFGSRMNCTCKSNCAPVTLTCGESDNNAAVGMLNNDIQLHVTFVAQEYLFMCGEGYILHGADKASCSNEPMCTDPPLNLTCLDLDVGRIGDEINCICNGNCLNVTVTCDKAGQWNYNDTMCTENDEWLKHVSPGLIMTFSTGAIHFKCEDELIIIGDVTASCINGTFDKGFPHCDNEECDDETGSGMHDFSQKAEKQNKDEELEFTTHSTVAKILPTVVTDTVRYSTRQNLIQSAVNHPSRIDEQPAIDEQPEYDEIVVGQQTAPSSPEAIYSNAKSAGKFETEDDVVYDNIGPVETDDAGYMKPVSVKTTETLVQPGDTEYADVLNVENKEIVPEN